MKMRGCEDVKMRGCEDEKMFYRPPLLEEPCAQTLSGKNKDVFFDANMWKYIFKIKKQHTFLNTS